MGSPAVGVGLNTPAGVQHEASTCAAMELAEMLVSALAPERGHTSPAEVGQAPTAAALELAEMLVIAIASERGPAAAAAAPSEAKELEATTAAAEELADMLIRTLDPEMGATSAAEELADELVKTLAAQPGGAVTPAGRDLRRRDERPECAAPAAAPASPKEMRRANRPVEKPKKAKTAFWLFSVSMQKEIAREQDVMAKGLAAGGYAKADKLFWEAKAAEDQRRHDDELRAYQELHDPLGALRTKCKHLIPRKPPSPLALFSQDTVQRRRAVSAFEAEGKAANSRQLAKMLSRMWKAASDSERAEYEERHFRAALEFLVRMKAWQASPEFAELQSAVKAQLQLLSPQASEASRREGDARGAERARKRSFSHACGSPSPNIAAKDLVTPPAKVGKLGTSAALSPVGVAGRPQRAAPTPRRLELDEKVKPRRAAPAPRRLELDFKARPRRAAAAYAVLPRRVVELDGKVLADAVKCGLEPSLVNLASRVEVSGQPAHALLDALRRSGGLVHLAKRALMGR